MVSIPYFETRTNLLQLYHKQIIGISPFRYTFFLRSGRLLVRFSCGLLLFRFCGLPCSRGADRLTTFRRKASVFLVWRTTGLSEFNRAAIPAYKDHCTTCDSSLLARRALSPKL